MFDFSVAFSSTDALFGQTGTLTQAGTAYTCPAIFEEIVGAVQTTEGVMIPDGACAVHVTKSGLATTPARGDALSDGTRTYDVISPPTEDPSRLGWVLTTKRRY